MPKPQRGKQESFERLAAKPDVFSYAFPSHYEAHIKSSNSLNYPFLLRHSRRRAQLHVCLTAIFLQEQQIDIKYVLMTIPYKA